MVAAALALSLVAVAQDPWKAWEPLLGEWIADARPDGSTGSFTLERAVDGRVLLRKNVANYPPSNDRPAAHHEDLMVVFQEGGATRADYFDNEGHVIRYAVTFGAGKAQFVSDAVPGAPRFRLTYRWSNVKALDLTFEIAPPGALEDFRPYIQATLHRATRSP